MILTMDSSGSMLATDVARPNDSGAWRGSFMIAPDDFRVGVVSFSDQADIVVPPTDDRAEALRGLDTLVADSAPSAMRSPARSISVSQEASTRSSRLRPDDFLRRRVLVLSDRANTTGDYEPLEAAQKAVDAKVPVCTVALRTDEAREWEP